jgi:hypothetical protein
MPVRSSNAGGGSRWRSPVAGAVEFGEGEGPSSPGKNPAAVALGRLGGLKGGRARAERLSSEQRRVIAQRAALARWQKKISVKG